VPGNDPITELERQQLDLVDPTAHTFWHWVRFDVMTAVAERRTSTQIVDIGAGSGMLGDRLGRTHPHLDYRFDEVSPALDEMLGRRFGAAARLASDERIGPDSTAAMLDVIEHIEDDLAALTAWRQRMDAGAALVVTVPAMQWAFSKFDTDIGHYRRYSKRRLRSTLESAGFVVDHCHYLFPELLPLVIKRRLRQSTNTVDMPQMSPWKNKVGYAVSSTTVRLRSVWPVGTSVVAICHVA
jgi:hypothetical protein